MNEGMPNNEFVQLLEPLCMSSKAQFFLVHPAPHRHGRFIDGIGPFIGVQVVAVLGGYLDFGKLTENAILVPAETGEV